MPIDRQNLQREELLRSTDRLLRSLPLVVVFEGRSPYLLSFCRITLDILCKQLLKTPKSELMEVLRRLFQNDIGDSVGLCVVNVKDQDKDPFEYFTDRNVQDEVNRFLSWYYDVDELDYFRKQVIEVAVPENVICDARRVWLGIFIVEQVTHTDVRASAFRVVDGVASVQTAVLRIYDSRICEVRTSIFPSKPFEEMRIVKSYTPAHLKLADEAAATTSSV